MDEGPILRLFPLLVEPQLSVAPELEPLIVMGTVDPELVRVAVPDTTQFADKPPAQVPVAVSVTVSEPAVKLIVPGTVVVEFPQSRVNE
jgi:hypothetical protein